MLTVFKELHWYNNVKFVWFSGIKKYIVGLIIKTSSEATLMEREKVYLGKLNMILVQVCCFCLHCHMHKLSMDIKSVVKFVLNCKRIKKAAHCCCYLIGVLVIRAAATVWQS